MRPARRSCPGMVDGHSHLTMPGGAHWIDRARDPTERLLDVAEDNGRLLTAGRRPLGARRRAPVARADPVDGGATARSRSASAIDGAAAPTATRTSARPGPGLASRARCPALAVEAADADELLAAAMAQLDDGADLVKLYLDGPDAGRQPVDGRRDRAASSAAVHARGARVTAHCGHARRGAGRRRGRRRRARARLRARRGRRAPHGRPTATPRLDAVRLALVADVRPDDDPAPLRDPTRVAARIAARRERAEERVRPAHAAGVAIATGTDFGGGSTRANQLAWEVEPLVEAGLEPWEALGAATWRGGELLGEPEAGVIREGGPADFVLVHGDPLSDPPALWRAWHVSWASDPG